MKQTQLLHLHTHALFKCSTCVEFFFFALAAEIPSDTKVSLLHLKELFPLERFEGRLPVVIVKHQLYSLINGRTAVDKELVSRFLSFIFVIQFEINSYYNSKTRLSLNVPAHCLIVYSLHVCNTSSFFV